MECHAHTAQQKTISMLLVQIATCVLKGKHDFLNGVFRILLCNSCNMYSDVDGFWTGKKCNKW